MTIDEVLLLLTTSQQINLTPLQELVLRCSWEGKTYANMALEAHYGEERVRKVASNLWHLLSSLWGEPINKANFRATLEPRRLTKAQQQLIISINRPTSSAAWEFPTGPVSLESKFYVVRPPIEELGYAEIVEPGSVIRIKAPRRMGKTSLMLRLLAHANSLGYRTVSLDFQQADSSIFASLDKFLRWFSANVTRELQLPPRLDEFWDEDIGSKVSCTIYFQEYLLAAIQSPLVLALNEVNLLFDYPEIAQDFLPLLRYWYEQAKQVEIWQKLRLVAAYSTEIYTSLYLNQSPFNVGLPLKLPPFSKEQVQDLALRHGLLRPDSHLDEQSLIAPLLGMVGGHPHLLRLAFYHLVKGDVTPEELLAQAGTEAGIYHEHLHQYVLALQGDRELQVALQQVLNSQTGVQLDSRVASKLDSMGLVVLEGDRAQISCELYRLYFQNQFAIRSSLSRAVPQLPAENGITQSSGELLTQQSYLQQIQNANHPALTSPRLQKLEQENQQLRYLSSLDELTQLPNRRYCYTYLQIQWKKLAQTGASLSLLLCDIDYFKIYNKTYGYATGDDCLRRIARTVLESVKGRFGQPSWEALSPLQEQLEGDLIARYGGEEFVVIMPSTDALTAVYVAEHIREAVKALAIPADYPNIGGLPASVLTVSLGVAHCIPEKDGDPMSLVRSVEQALYQSKRKGRDRVTLS